MSRNCPKNVFLRLCTFYIQVAKYNLSWLGYVGAVGVADLLKEDMGKGAEV